MAPNAPTPDDPVNETLAKALLNTPETYDDFVSSLSGAVTRDVSGSILEKSKSPGSPTYGSFDRAPFAPPVSFATETNFVDETRDGFVPAEVLRLEFSGTATAARRAPRVDQCAASLKAVMCDPSDFWHRQVGREDPTPAMLRDFRNALKTGDADASQVAVALLSKLQSPDAYGSFDVPNEAHRDGADVAHATDGDHCGRSFSGETPCTQVLVDTLTRPEEGGSDTSELTSELTRPILSGAGVTKNTYGSTARDENENEKDEKKSSLVSPFALDQTFDYENVELTHRLAGLSVNSTPASESSPSSSSMRKQSDPNASPGRASARMRKRARARRAGNETFEAVTEPFETGTGTIETFEDDDGRRIPAENSQQKEVFKIQCGACSAMLKIPNHVRVFRCPECASKLLAPSSVGNDVQAESFGPDSKKETLEKTRVENDDVADDTELETELALSLLRKKRLALERHVAFSKSLEDVVLELQKRVPPVVHDELVGG